MAKDYIPETIGWGGADSTNRRVSCAVVAGNLLSPVFQAPISPSMSSEIVSNAFEKSGTTVQAKDETGNFFANDGATVFQATNMDSANGDYVRTPSGTSGVEVTPGNTYHAEAVFAHETNTGTVTLDLKWYDSSGSLLSTDTVGSATVGVAGVAIYSSLAAPSNAEFAALELTTDASDHLHFAPLAIRPDDDRKTIVKALHATAASKFIHYKRIWGNDSPPEHLPMDTANADMPVLEVSGGSTIEPNMVLENGDYIMHDNDLNANCYAYVTGILVLP